MIELDNLEFETRNKWTNDNFVEHKKIPFSVESPFLHALAKKTPWQEYEQYMQAKVLISSPNEMGLLHIKFAPETIEENRLHTHLHTDRLVTVIEGNGYFLIAPLGEKIKSIPVTIGDRIWMPRNVRHTWYAGKSGLLVESIHNPFIGFESPDILIYDQNRGFVSMISEGQFIEKMLTPEFSKKVRQAPPVSIRSA